MSNYFSVSNIFHHKWIYVVILILLVFLFISGPDYYSSRSYKYAWDFGHIVFFAILIAVLMNQWRWLAGTTFIKQIIFCTLFTLIIGVLIEILQIQLHRTFEFGDLKRNFIGSFFALFFFSPLSKELLGIFKYLVRTIIILFIAIELWPVTKSVIDENIARFNFPILADFETPFEKDRWIGRTMFTINSDITKQGKFSLKITLNTDEYSGVTLKYFPHDWSGYQSLSFSVFNSSSDSIRLHFRVNDYLHIQSGQRYADRFNEIYELHPGWNDISISMNKIKSAPKKRSMDLSRILGFGVFVMNMPSSKTIYLDEVRLVE